MCEQTVRRKQLVSRTEAIDHVSAFEAGRSMRQMNQPCPPIPNYEQEGTNTEWLWLGWRTENGRQYLAWRDLVEKIAQEGLSGGH